MNLKVKLSAFTVLCCALLLSHASAERASKVEGIWVNEAGTGIIRISIDDQGKLKGLGAHDDESGIPVRLDENNPDPKLRDRPLEGTPILWGFKPKNKSKTSWGKGRIYDPDNGKTYKCKLKLKNDGKLHIRGYVGVSMFGRTEVWTRYKNQTI